MPRKGVRALLVLPAAVVAAALSAPAPCSAEGAARGESLFAEARFDEARAAFETLLESPEATAADLASAHLHLSALGLVAGDEAEARRHARLAVALAPAPTVPEGAPLRLEELLAEALSGQGAGGLSVAIELPSCPAAGAPVRARAEVAGAPAGLVGSVALRCTVGQSSRETEETGAGGVAVLLDATGAAPGDELACEASVRSPTGVTLRSRRLAVSLCRAQGVADVVAAGDEGPPDGADLPAPRRAWLWVGIGAGAAALAAASIAVGVVLGTAPTEARLGSVEIGGP